VTRRRRRTADKEEEGRRDTGEQRESGRKN